MRSKKNGYIYTDTALSEIQEYLNGKNDWDVERGDISTVLVEFFITVKGLRLRLWFNSDKQVYGFDMLNGGSKTGKTLDMLVELFENYIKVNTELVPISKSIALELDELCGIKALFKSIVGNSADGYSALFNIINSDGFVKVREDNGIYIAEVHLSSADGDSNEYKFNVIDDKVEYIDDSGLSSEFKKVLKEYDYELIENGTVRIDFYSDNTEIILREKKDIGVELICCIVKGWVFDFLKENPVLFEDYDIEAIRGYTQEENFDAKLLLLSLCQNYGVKEEDAEITEDGVLTINGDEVVCIDDFVKSKKQLSGINDLVQPEEPKEQIMNPPEGSDTTESTPCLISKLVYNNEVVGVQALRGNELFTIDLDVAKSVGLRPERILNETSMVARNGVLVSDDEIKLHRFANKIEESADIYELLDCLF